MATTCSTRDERPSLEDLRVEIDRLDGEIFRLVEQRLSCALQIAAAKELVDCTQLKFRPDREAEIIRRLSARAEIMADEEVATVWRELMGVSLQRQQAIALHVHAPTRTLEIVDAARRTFGCAPPLVGIATAEDALRAAGEEDVIAVVELTPGSAWWRRCGEEGRVIAFDVLRSRTGEPLALSLARLLPEHRPAATRYGAIEGETPPGAEILARDGDWRLCAFITDEERRG